ncbi:mechanosensitive ion channel family protein [Caminibacter mediatlanticus TB-2]|uniref:Mechanosensitive ion channel family protein n=1 Tax=Caminibacter mediatlanticus TB-2 TaxID=391592 RepID=A0ABX5V941_9BACT|nr:mechanosensitive ion channel family protein [Caminibacter mediatlanticus]QCT93907.1 mechanosensitive ion channel family protein [Caminibacter mediatlanticus TB-2]
MGNNYLNELIKIMNYKLLTIPLYKIILAFLVLFLFLILRKIFTMFILSFLKKLTLKTKTNIDDKFILAIKNPLRFLFIIFGFYFFFQVLGVELQVINHIIKGLLILDIFWAIYNIIDVFQEEVYKVLGRFGKASRELASFIIKITKVLIISIGIIALLQDWGINVTGFIASLGLGGLAFALAAKDTAANIFGGIAILTDNIFKIGEWIKVGGAEGIVEDIGIRTTKIRAFDKRLIVVPNATIANSNVENFSRRDKRRIVMRIGLIYNTPKEIIEKIVNDIREMLKSHPDIAKDESLLIYFDEFEDSSLSIFCYFFTNTAVWSEYLRIKEDINLKIKDIVEKNGSSFAFPSNSIYFETPLRLEND